MVTRIISGGQTGADQTGLEVAASLGIETGGWAPKYWRTEDGAAPWLAELGLFEHPVPGYVERTRDNVHDSDATVIFGDTSSAGSRLTIRCCEEFHVPYLANPTASALRAFIAKHDVRTLNVAGNRASVNPDVVEQTRTVLMEALS